MSRSSWRHFKLLLWKNFLLKIRHKKDFATEIIIPLLFCCILIIIRYLTEVRESKKPTIYPPLPINSIQPLMYGLRPNMVKWWELDYTPKNPLTDKIVENAAASLGIGSRGFANEISLEKFMMHNKSFAGVVFDRSLASATDIPKSIKFALRFPGSPRTVEGIVLKPVSWMTKHLFPREHHVGPRNKNYSDGGLPPGYIREGFMAVQYAVTSSIIKLAAKEPVEMPTILLQRYPFPPYVEDRLLLILQSMAAVILILSFTYPLTQSVKHVTAEKELQLKEAMKIMGLSITLHWAAWFVTLWSCMMVTVVFILCMVKVPWFNDFTVSVLTYSDWTLLLVFLSLYVAAAVTFCFMLSSFFNRANVAAAAAGLLWFLFYIPFSFSINNFVEMSLATKLAMSIFINSALPFGLKLIVKWETLNEGANWDNVVKTVTVEDHLSLAYIMGMMAIDALLYILIAMYVEKVKPGKYGVPHKWYFLCSKDFWCPKRVFYADDEGSEILDTDKFEPEYYPTQKVGIRLMNLRKKFGKKVVVDGLSMNMYEGHITVLLGHNGAGKTTTISMITGIIQPTSGNVIVNGLDIHTNMKEVRRTFGYCPQHNILFEELTVREHLVFYSRLKGLSDDQVEAEADKYLKLLDFENKRNALARTLSGGMKRKLSVGVALCGNSKVVLFDEPSSGMDPAARRTLWDLLLTEKRGRTILLTTHFMDEADVLGDRIAIMSLGKLKCSGSPFFLKKKFGTGYLLVINKGKNCKTDKVTELLRQYIPEIELKSDVGMELSYRLPERYVKSFETTLSALEKSQKDLDLDGYGISMTTLEDVFMRTGSDVVSRLFINDPASNSVSSIDFFGGKDSSDIIGKLLTLLIVMVVWLLLINTRFVEANEQEFRPVRGVKRMEYHWRAMFLKKFYLFIRNLGIFFIQLFIPLLFIVLSIYISKSMSSNTELPPLQIDLNQYANTITLLQSSAPSESVNGRIAETYEKQFRSNYKGHKLVKIKRSLIDEIVSREKGQLEEIETRYMVAAAISEAQIIGMFNNEALHTAPLTLHLISNAIVKSLLGEDYSIHVTNEPLPYDLSYRLMLLKNTIGLGFQLALNLAFSMSFISATFIMFLIKERYSRAKLLQFVSGVRVMTFWLSHFIWDFAIYVVITVFIVLLMYAFQQEGFKTREDLERIFIVFVVYGFASLPLTYLVSFLYEEPSTGLSRLSIFNIFTGNALYVIVTVMDMPEIDLKDLAHKLRKIFLIFPNFALAQALSNQAEFATSKGICLGAEDMLQMSKKMICKTLMPDCCKLEPYGFENPGIGRVLLCMLVMGAVTALVLLFVEYFQRSIFKKLTNHFLRASLPPPRDHDEDEDSDVKEERKRVQALSPNELRKHNLVLRDVSKFYKKFLAVHRISLAINRGECFGLLGNNGAGKTTTFKMLTGDEHITYGNAWVKGYNVKNNMKKIYEMIGYCPQFDGLFFDLTGREMLRIFCLLRGVPTRFMNLLITRLSRDLAFQKHLDKKIVDYSGGNRRKLSTAIAIMGHPHVIYLDEPTSGIDPASRRKLWDVICMIRDFGKGIVISSHSMEECEALCTRIAIMVNGEIKCLGSTQHLKDKFSKGITLSVKLKQMEVQNGYYDQDDTNMPFGSTHPDIALGSYGRDLYVFIIQQFEGATLKDCHKNLLTFSIPSNIMPYSRIFGLMEANRERLHIEDYSLSQTTLEQVFLDFVQKQRSNDKAKRKFESNTI